MTQTLILLGLKTPSANLSELVKVGSSPNEVARGAYLVSNVAHINEIYGSMAVLLLKGPSLEMALLIV